MRRDVLERPLQVLMPSELASQCSRLLAAQPQKTVVSGQHRSVVLNDLRVIVIGSESKMLSSRCLSKRWNYSQNVIKRNVLRDFRIIDNLLCVLGAVDGCVVPERQQRLLVVVRWNARLGQLRVEQLPQRLDVWS